MRDFRRIVLSAALLAAALLLVRVAGAPSGAPSAARPALPVKVAVERGDAAAGGATRSALVTQGVRKAPAQGAGGVAAAAGAASASPPAPTPVVGEVVPGPGVGSQEPEPPASIELDPLVLGDVTASVEGHDPLAPRPLLLWRRVGGRVAVMARGRSRPDGSLDFPDLVLPDAGLEVVVTGAGATPDDENASEPRFVGARPLEPPRARVLEAGDGEFTLRILPVEASGEVWLAGPDGDVFGRHALPPHPAAPGRAFDLQLSLPQGERRVWLAHARADGRLSHWRLIELPVADLEENP